MLLFSFYLAAVDLEWERFS